MKMKQNSPLSETGRQRGLFQHLVKVLVLPFRFVWLLIVWVRLRRRAARAAG